MEALEKYPVIIALKKIALRLAKCHPFHPGGEDLP
jgi:putative component of membrane protein insertase Oxa1/YidC/SpoIIIJ protein YidD